jgi:hypothetical protein
MAEKGSVEKIFDRAREKLNAVVGDLAVKLDFMTKNSKQLVL